MTFDGAPENISAVRKLGADLNAIKSHFVNPYDPNNPIFIVLDPPHMLKLVRNCLERHKVLHDKDGNEIKWAFITELINLQTLHNINISNKLTKTHANFRNNKMNVKLAAQTISNSTSTAIEFMDKVVKSPEFSNSDGTVLFLRIFNNVFDISNTKPKHTDQKYKRPFSKDTCNEFSSYFETTSDYIRGLTTLKMEK